MLATLRTAAREFFADLLRPSKYRPGYPRRGVIATGTAGRPIDPVPVVVSFVYGEALALDLAFFVAARAYRVHKIIFRPLVVGSDGSAVSATLRKAPSGTAVASGTLLNAGSADLKGTINTNQVLGLTTTTADLNIAAGDAIGMDVTGVLTAARGVVSVELIPLA
jgi:hypothetical protein